MEYQRSPILAQEFRAVETALGGALIIELVWVFMVPFWYFSYKHVGLLLLVRLVGNSLVPLALAFRKLRAFVMQIAAEIVLKKANDKTWITPFK